MHFLKDTRISKVVKDLWGNKTRTALVVLSISVGVFAVGMTANAQSILIHDINALYSETNPASLYIYTSPFSKELAEAVEGMREVHMAEARRLESAEAASAAEGYHNIELSAVPDYSQIRVSTFSVEQGNGRPGLREILLERKSARLLHVTTGDTVTVRMSDGEEYLLTVAGIIHDLHKIPYVFSGQMVGYVSMDTLIWMGESPYYNRLDVVVAEDGLSKAHILDVGAQAKDRVIEPTGVRVGRMVMFNPGKHWANSEIEALTLVLSVLGVMCVFLSAGLVVNTISAIITQQIQQIGIMRSVGALRPQVVQIYLASVMVFGVLALTMAIPFGILSAWWVCQYAAGLLNFDLLPLQPPVGIIILQIVIGMIVPVFAAFVPIFSGTSISVYDAIYQSGARGAERGGWLDRMLGRLRGLPRPIMLSLRNTFRKKTRLGFTLATLTLAGATFIAVISTRASLISTLDKMSGYWQFDVSIGVPYGTMLYQAEREALRVPGVTIAEGWGRADGYLVRADGSQSEGINVFAPPPDSQTLKPVLMDGRFIEVGDTRQVVVNADLVDLEEGAGVGDEIILRIGETERRYEVVGVVSGQLSGPAIYMTYDAFTRVTNTQGQVNLIRVRLDAERLATGTVQEQVATDLEDRFENAGLGSGQGQTQSRILSDTSSQFSIILNFLLIMAALLAVVGGLGLAGTMSLNVLERVREIGVLRAVGASNHSVRQVVLVEGILIGLLSWGLGAIVSVPFGMLLSNAVGLAFLKITLDFSYSFFGLGMWLVLITLIATAASLLPAQRASRLTVREVLAYE